MYLQRNQIRVHLIYGDSVGLKKIEFEYQGQFCNGEVLDILDDGSLLVQMNNKKITINYGEVSLKNFYEEGVWVKIKCFFIFWLTNAAKITFNKSKRIKGAMTSWKTFKKGKSWFK